MERGREAEVSGDLPRGLALGVHDHGKAQFLAHHMKLPRVLRVAHARNGIFRAELLRHDAAQDIELVGGRGRYDKVGARYAGFHLDVIARAVALDADDIVHIHRIVEHRALMVDHRHVVPFGGKLLRQS